MNQENLQNIYDYLQSKAKEALTGGLSISPFGAAIRKTGEKTHLAADLPPEDSAPEDHIAALIEALRQEDASVGLIAAGLVFDSQVELDSGSTAALMFHIEVANGDAVEIVLPYRRPDGVAVEFESPLLQPIYPEIFTDLSTATG